VADNCQEFVDKSKPALTPIGNQGGKPLADEHFVKLAERCRTQAAESKDRVVVDCVIAAANDNEVSMCWATAMDRYVAAGLALEADLLLNRLARTAKVYFIGKGELPRGKAPWSKACCAQPGGVCKHDPNEWNTGVWTELWFVVDGDHRGRYAVDSTPSRFEASAMVDTDCNGKAATITVVVTVDSGSANATFSTSGADD